MKSYGFMLLQPGARSVLSDHPSKRSGAQLCLSGDKNIANQSDKPQAVKAETMATMDDDEGPQLVHIATLGETALPDKLTGVALILKVPEEVNPATGRLADWINLCSDQECALITASMSTNGEDLPPNGVDGFVSFDMAADRALREDFPDMQIIAADLRSRDAAMQAGEMGADALFFGDLRATDVQGMQASLDQELAEWWVEMMEVPCIVPVNSPKDDPDYAPEFIAVPLG